MAMITPTDDNQTPGSEQQSNRRRRKKSVVWEHFTIETVDAGCTRACCKQCKKSFAYITGSKLAGTSHLKRHIALGICPVSRQKNLLTPYTPAPKNQLTQYTPAPKNDGSPSTTTTIPPRRRYKTTPVNLTSFSFDQDRSTHDIAKMIILHEYPLNMVEQPGFVDFVRALQPQFNFVNVDIILGECMGVYLREKQSLLNIIGGIAGHVNLSLDLWTSDQDLGFVFLTGHFIDTNWTMHRRILNVITLPFPDIEVAFNHAVVACLTDWNLEGKLFTITLDQSFASEAVRRNLNSLLSIRNPLILNGQLLIGSCYARVLSRLAQAAINSTTEIIKKVRDSVKYVKTLEVHEERFVELKEQLQVPSTKSLFIDDQSKWNTTYHMLVAACELKEVFSCLDTSDPNYKETPSMDEWKQVQTLCVYLKLFFDAANILTAPKYPTANIFFHEVWKIQIELTHAAMSPDTFISNLTKPLQEMFDKYWKDSSLVFAIAVVMDPRFKMKLVEFSFTRMYGEDADTWIKIVEQGLQELFVEYIVLSLPPPTFEVGNGHVKSELLHEDALLCAGDGLMDFELYISQMMSNQEMKTELDRYLEEPLLPRVQDFDILGWWKLNQQNYPNLSKMAADILSIPVCTVAPDSVFDTVSKKMDSYRSSLRPVTLETLICAKDWLQYGSSEFSNAIVKMEY